MDILRNIKDCLYILLRFFPRSCGIKIRCESCRFRRLHQFANRVCTFYGKTGDKTCAFAYYAIGLYTASMLFYDPFRDRKPQPETVCGLLVHSVKAVKNACQMLEGNAPARIRYGELYFIVFLGNIDLYSSRFERLL